MSNSLHQISAKANALNFIDVPKLDKTIESVEKLKEDLYECYIKPDRDDDKWQ